MANMIKIKKGLDIKLKGRAAETIVKTPRATLYGISPDDFHGVVPKVVVKPGDRVLAGSPLMVDKNCPEIKFVSFVSGEVVAVNRGERRKVLDIQVKPDQDGVEQMKFESIDLSKASAEQIKASMLEMGLWPFIKQRPYDVIANPNETPRDIFVTGFDSAPLAPSYDTILKKEEIEELQVGLTALTKLTTGKVYLAVRSGSALANVKGVEVVIVDGPHPAGNVGVQIHNISPINKGETVWTLNALDLSLIGKSLRNGALASTRKIAIVGSEVASPCYTETIIGSQISPLVEGNLVKGDCNLRFIAGNVLTGRKVSTNSFLSPYVHQITVIPEGDDVHEMFGWAMPGFDKMSASKSYFSWLFPNREYRMDARIRGGVRAIIMSGEYDNVLPMDILPEFLIKETLAFNIEKMENLGIYEVAPEDFALCEFVDTSKLPIQHIIRTGLDQLRKEMI